jgi:pimeloyl-ACP methyl ester carboxylesterase
MALSVLFDESKGSISMATPTIVLIHGAFADSASFGLVTRQLLDKGYTVRVPAVPNRSLLGDAEYIKSVVEHIDGPVLLVGHSYGGAVITIAGVADNVVGLVYVAGYALDEGENLGQLQGRFPDSALAKELIYTPFPIDGSDPGTDVSVNVEAFPAIFAKGVDQADAEVFAVSQRPLAAIAFEQGAPVAAWKTKPAWGIVSGADQTINPDVERFGYKRGNFRGVVEVEGAPHLVMRSHPDDVVKVIVDAVTELG